jgi:hypothetical protein
VCEACGAKARTPVQAGNLLSALRHIVGWMIEEEHIEPDDDPTIGLKSGKAKASRESGGWVPWTEEDMAKYRARWPLGTEARLMFDILHYTHLRLGDASRFGPEHLQRTLKTMMVKVATEKSKGRTTATVPVHRDFAVSLAAARNAGMFGTGEVFTGKLVKGEIAPTNKKAWAAKFKKFARLAGVNEPKKNCHGVRKARAEVAAYSDCTEAQIMAMFGWRDHKMPALYIPIRVRFDALRPGGRPCSPDRRNSALLRLDVGCTDQPGPLFDIGSNGLAEVGGRGPERRNAKFGEMVLYCAVGEASVDFLVKPLDDLRGRARGNADAEPAARLVARHIFSHRRNVR